MAAQDDTCPACEAGALERGSLVSTGAVRFWPEGKLLGIGRRVEALACPACGHLVLRAEVPG